MHLELAELSRACHARVAEVAGGLEGTTARTRGFVRTMLGVEMMRLDEQVRRLLDAPAPVAAASGTLQFDAE